MSVRACVRACGSKVASTMPFWFFMFLMQIHHKLGQSLLCSCPKVDPLAALATPASTMISPAPAMNNAAAAAYTELQARTQFILDRAAFLKDVGLTLMDEGKPVADAKINVWLNNAYVPLIVRCIKSDDAAVRIEALWTVANLLGADSDAVREATKAALTSDLLRSVLDYVFLESKETVECAAFLLSNYARFKNLSYADAQAIVYSACAKGIIVNGKAANDLLWAANYAADKFPAAIPLSLVVNTLGDVTLTKEKSRQLRRLLGIAAEQDGLVHANLLEPVMNVLMRMLETAAEPAVRAELFWILSNVLTEPTAPDAFFNKKDLLQATIDESCEGTNAGLQALYALANFVTLTKDAAIQSDLGSAVALDLEHMGATNEYAFDIHEIFSQLESAKSAVLRALGSEVLSAMRGYADIFYPEVEVINMEDEDEDEEMSDDEEESRDDVPYYGEASITYINPEITAPTIPLAHTEESIAPTSSVVDPSGNEWNVRVPCAYELLYGSDRASCESRTVRRLVAMVEQAMADPDAEGDGWVKVPMDTVLSVGDLVTLQHMGYVFDGEWLGVNPAIYSGY